jgi:hypothetical protein
MKATLFAVFVPLLLAGCTTPSPLPEVTAYRSPVSAGAKVPKTHHHTTLTGYTHREPTAPEPWVTEDAPAVPEAVPEATPDATMKKEDCKKVEGAKDDCAAQ